MLGHAIKHGPFNVKKVLLICKEQKGQNVPRKNKA